MSNQPPPDQPEGQPPGTTPGQPNEQPAGGTPTTNIPPQVGYSPPPQSGGYTPSPSGGGDGGYAAPPQGGYAPPPQGGGDGGYNAPQSGGYAPPQGGYAPPPQGEAGGGYAPPPQGGYAPPPQQGGYAPPPQQGGYAPPPQGGYAPPPQGGYAPPPQQGGYAPPPQQGGYAPPPGGYTPPPAGGYGAPPPPPSPPINLGAVNQAAVQGMIPKYQKAVTNQTSAFYEAEIPNASWNSVLIGVGGTAVIGALATFLGTLFGFSVGMMAFGGGGAAFGFTAALVAAIIALVVYPISFFIGAGVLFLMPKLFGGQGTDFMTHSYLLSLSYAPLRSIAAVLEIIPVIGTLLAWVVRLWQGYQAGLAIQAYHKLDRAKAQMSVWIPIGIVAVFVLLSYATTFMALSRLGTANRR